MTKPTPAQQDRTYTKGEIEAAEIITAFRGIVRSIISDFAVGADLADKMEAEARGIPNVIFAPERGPRFALYEHARKFELHMIGDHRSTTLPMRLDVSEVRKLGEALVAFAEEHE